MNHYDNILPYLKKQLSSEQKQAFETAMKTDAVLKKALQEEELLLEQMEIQRLRKKVTALHESEKITISASKPIAKIISLSSRAIYRYAIAASVMGFLAIGLGWFFQDKNNQDLAKNIPNITSPNLNNEAKNTATTSTTALPNPKNTPAPSIKEDINQKNVSQSKSSVYDMVFADEMKNINGELMSNTEVNTLNNAKQLLKNNQVQEAFILLQQLQQKDKDNEDIEWFLAVVQLKLDKNAAFTLLQNIAKKDGKYQDKAAITLRRLEGN